MSDRKFPWVETSIINLEFWTYNIFGTIYFKGRTVRGLNNILANDASKTEYEQHKDIVIACLEGIKNVGRTIWCYGKLQNILK